LSNYTYDDLKNAEATVVRARRAFHASPNDTCNEHARRLRAHRAQRDAILASLIRSPE
jgi:hypothetical protein